MVTFNRVAPDPDTICLVSLDGKTWEHKTWREIQEIINPKQELYYDDLNIKEAS